MPEPIPTPAAPVDSAPAPVADESTVDDNEAIPGSEALGDPGKKALDAMKAKWKAAEAKAQSEADARAALEAKIEGKEADYAKDQERRNVESAALAKANTRILKAEIRAAAAGKLADPADALLYLDLSRFEVGDDGDVDTDAVASAIEALAKAKPYLAAQRGTGPVFESPGAHRKGAPAGQLTQEQVKQLYAEKKYDEIDQARQDGRLASIFGATS
jgi:hypothetical protein